jgi:ActR/RegA family two-component response regulator
MVRFNGNSIFIVDADRVYAIQLKQILEERGAMVTIGHTLADAKKTLNRVDFDLLICTLQLADGSARELMEWCKDSLSNIPSFGTMGNSTELERKQLAKLGINHFFSKIDSIKLINDISRALFSFDEFKKNYLEASFERGVVYELVAGSKTVNVKALEIMDTGVFLSFDPPFGFGQTAHLNMTSTPDLHIESLSVKGVLQGEFTGGQFFKVDKDHLDGWKKLLGQLDKKQEEVSMFLKKASGK